VWNNIKAAVGSGFNLLSFDGTAQLFQGATGVQNQSRRFASRSLFSSNAPIVKNGYRMTCMKRISWWAEVSRARLRRRKSGGKEK
jgi:hypothetical protein